MTAEGRNDAPATDPEEPQSAPNAFQRLGFYALLAYLFFRFSFLHEFITNKLNVDTHIIISLSFVCYGCALLSGRIAEAFRHKITWMWLGFGVFMAIATATSFWHGGSFMILMDYLRTVLPIIIVIPALLVTRDDVQKSVGAIGVACIAAVLLGLINNDFKTGRMSINAVGSDIQDSNDYAAHLILMLPALAYLTMRAGKSMVFRVVGILSLAVSMYEILSTGSRGGFVSMALTALYIAFTGNSKLKIGILVGVPVLILVAIPFIPEESAARLGTLVNSGSGARAEEATESSQARWALLQQSLKITMEHPVTGVGPGEFMDYQAEDAKSAGARGMWHVSHNAYAQISSECGIPALLLYLGAILSTFLALRRYKRLKNEWSLLCGAMSVMIVGFSICIFFLSLAYNAQIVALSGIAVAIQSIALPEGQRV